MHLLGVLMAAGERVPPEVAHLALLFTLFVLPRVLQRFRLPQAVTSVGIGAAVGLGLGWFEQDPTVNLLATLGIVSLFLFAGLDVDFEELWQEARVLLQHVALGLGALLLTALVAGWSLGLDFRAATLVALALLTPSCGFILDSLTAWGFGGRPRFWVRCKAIATERVALATLVVAMQSRALAALAGACAAMLALVALLPLVFWSFARVVLPHASKSEFAFLLAMTVFAALV